ATGGVGVAVEAAHGAGLRIDVVAVAVQLLLAEEAAAAEDVERHQHPVADLQVLHRGPHFLHHAAELVADDRADPRVRPQAVVDVDARAAEARARAPDDGVVGVLEPGFGDVFDAHPAWTPVGGGEHGGAPGGTMAGIRRHHSTFAAWP